MFFLQFIHSLGNVWTHFATIEYIGRSGSTPCLGEQKSTENKHLESNVKQYVSTNIQGIICCTNMATKRSCPWLSQTDSLLLITFFNVVLIQSLVSRLIVSKVSQKIVNIVNIFNIVQQCQQCQPSYQYVCMSCSSMQLPSDVRTFVKIASPTASIVRELDLPVLNKYVLNSYLQGSEIWECVWQSNWCLSSS